MLRIAIAGASGRMGQMLIEAVCESDDLRLAAALDRADSPSLGRAASPTTVITSDIAAALRESDVLIDFTRPDATLVHVAACVSHGVRLVIGTTGFDSSGAAAITAAARHIAIVQSPNMSIGVNVVFKLLEDATRALGDGYDVEVIEAHHRHKVDAPSGTALRIGELIAAQRGVGLEDVAVFDRQTMSGPRPKSAIGLSSIGGGDSVGDHTVLYAADGERIEITHRATNRAGYARGSLMAARFLAGRANGLYDMRDVLGLA